MKSCIISMNDFIHMSYVYANLRCDKKTQFHIGVKFVIYNSEVELE